MSSSKPNPLDMVHFGWGGRRYMAPEGGTQWVGLPDGRVVALEGLSDFFPATGKLEPLPSQPTRISECLPFNVKRRALPCDDKNYIAYRLGFRHAGLEYQVSPEVLGKCPVPIMVKKDEKWTELWGDMRSVLIYIGPLDTFLELADEDGPTSSGYLEVSETTDRYILDSNGQPFVKESKSTDEEGNPVTVKKFVYRPHVWATGPFIVRRFVWEGDLYQASFMSKPRSFALPDGRFVSIEWEDHGIPGKLSLADNPHYSVSAVLV